MQHVGSICAAYKHLILILIIINININYICVMVYVNMLLLCSTHLDGIQNREMFTCVLKFSNFNNMHNHKYSIALIMN